jgi:hypothetical protein
VLVSRIRMHHSPQNGSTHSGRRLTTCTEHHPAPMLCRQRLGQSTVSIRQASLFQQFYHAFDGVIAVRDSAVTSARGCIDEHVMREGYGNLNAVHGPRESWSRTR